MKKILHISPDFNYNCGRSKLVFLYLLHFSKKHDCEVHFITNNGDSLERLKEIPSLRFERFRFSTGLINILFAPDFYRRLKNYLYENKISLVHTHHRFAEFISEKAAHSLNIPVIASAHNYVTGYKQLSFKSDKIICVCNSLRKYLRDSYDIQEEKLITLYNPAEEFPAVTPEQIEDERRRISISPDKKVLLFMGRISSNKGFDALLKSMKIINSRRNDILLLVCGSIEEKKFEKEITALYPAVKMVDSRRDNYILYPVADAVILPSRSDALPLVMIEAGTFRKPFIGGNTGGIAEFIEDGKNGLLADPENPPALAESIIHLLDNNDAAERMGNNLYEKVKDKCSYSNYFYQVEKLYNSLIPDDF